MTQTEIQQYVYDYLYEKALPHQTICAIMGNITGESGWDVTCIEQGSGIGFGLCQWSFGRRTLLENYGTDLEHQCNFLWSELTGENTAETGASLQWISNPADSVNPDSSYRFKLTSFIAGNGTVEDLTGAWCYCWERPAYATNHLDRRVESAETFNTTMTYQGTGQQGVIKPVPDYGGAMAADAANWAVAIAEDNTHGYDQTNRWGPDYDCSSLVISAYEQAGIPLKTNGATYTGDLLQVALNTGFQLVDDLTGGYVTGDILLADGHVAIYTWNNNLVEASINENGDVVGGETGDQTGKEIYNHSYYDYPWKYVLRYPQTPGNPDTTYKDSLYTHIEKTRYNLNLLTENEKTILKSLRLLDYCYIKHTFNKRKEVSGKNFLGKRLNIRSTKYIILDVDKFSGFVKVASEKAKLCFDYVNPKLILKSR